MIFICVGSREHPFDRLLKKIDELIETKVIREDVFAQVGKSTYTPKNYKYSEFIADDLFEKYLKDARVVITHGGTGSIVKSLVRHKKVIAVTRLKKYGEHVDDHQKQIVNLFTKQGVLLGVEEMDDMERAIHFFDQNACVPIDGHVAPDEPNMVQILDGFISANR